MLASAIAVILLFFNEKIENRNEKGQEGTLSSSVGLSKFGE